MVVTIWFIWFITIFFLFIILCNFMISYISQTYENVLENQLEDTYETRCQLNYEFYSVYKFLTDTIFKGKGDFIFNCFLLTADFECIELDSGEHTGLTRKIRSNLNNHELSIQKQIEIQNKKTDEIAEEQAKLK